VTGAMATFAGLLVANVWLVLMIVRANALAPPTADPEVHDDSSAAELHNAWVEEVVDESALRWEPCDVRGMGEAYLSTEVYIAWLRYRIIHGQATEAMLVKPMQQAMVRRLAVERCDPLWAENVDAPWHHSGSSGATFD